LTWSKVTIKVINPQTAEISILRDQVTCMVWEPPCFKSEFDVNTEIVFPTAELEQSCKWCLQIIVKMFKRNLLQYKLTSRSGVYFCCKKTISIYLFFFFFFFFFFVSVLLNHGQNYIFLFSDTYHNSNKIDFYW